MTTRDISGIRVRLEEAVAGLPVVPAISAEVLYQQIEMASYQVLDSWECYTKTRAACQMYLEIYLLLKRIEAGIIPLDSKEE